MRQLPGPGSKTSIYVLQTMDITMVCCKTLRLAMLMGMPKVRLMSQ